MYVNDEEKESNFRGGNLGVDLPLVASVTSPRSGDLPMLLLLSYCVTRL